MRTMNKSEMEDRIFEVMLKAAVEENFQKELQRLPKEEDLTDDYELSEAAKEKIGRAIRRAYRRSAWRRAGKVAKRAAVVLAVVIPVSLGSLLSVEASRNAIFNALLNWRSNYADIRYQEKGVSSGQAPASSGMSVMEPQYLPEGFTAVNSTKNAQTNIVEYQDSRGQRIVFEQHPLKDEKAIGADTEHTTLKEVTINGRKASLFVADSKGGTSYLVWENRTYSFLLSSAIDPEELVKMAESVGT